MVSDKNNRVILWGFKDLGEYIHAELAFFSSNLYANSIWISVNNADPKFKPIKVQIPDVFLKNHFPGRSQHIHLPIVERKTE